jgi:phosphoribosyl-dephospho-CoA transferase
MSPHDLLWVAPGAIRLDGPWPEWADAAWQRSAPVVVRREAVADGVIPVGLRGTTRSQRIKGYVAAGAVTRRAAPESLAVCSASAAGGFPALAALTLLAPAFDATGLAWGPTGGVGYFLACGLPVLRADSDLDVVVRAPQPLAASQAAVLDGIQAQGAACRIDIQVDTGHGAFAFAEWRRGGRVLLKTNTGPQLCADPWAETA